MGTKNNRSGVQYNPKGATQGTTLVDPNSGLPISVIEDTDDPAGLRRLAVDADVTIGDVTVNTRFLDCTTDSIEICDPTTSAHLRIENDGSINVNSRINASSDNIAISDGTNTVSVNPDGSLNVHVVTTATGTIKSFFTSVSAIASGSTVTIGTYTVPIGKTAFLQTINTSGANVAVYDVLINGVEFDRRRSWFAGQALNEVFNYYAYPNPGFLLNAGDTVNVTVFNYRPNSSDFESRIQVLEN